MTDRETTFAERRTIWNICHLIDSEFENRTRAEYASDGSNDPPGPSSRKDTKGISTDESGRHVVANTTSQTGKGKSSDILEEPADKLMSFAYTSKKVQKFLVLCVPRTTGRCVLQTELLGDPMNESDLEVIARLKAAYLHYRPKFRRLVSLWGISGIRVIRVGAQSLVKGLLLTASDSSNLRIVKPISFPLNLSGNGRKWKTKIGSGTKATLILVPTLLRVS